MYAFPSIKFSKSIIQEAEKRNQSPDLMYCLECLNQTGIALVPGSGFSTKTRYIPFPYNNINSPIILINFKT